MHCHFYIPSDFNFLEQKRRISNVLVIFFNPYKIVLNSKTAGFFKFSHSITFYLISGLQPINPLAFVSNDFANYGPPLPKRRLVTDEQSDNTVNEPVFKGYCAGTPPAPILYNADAGYVCFFMFSFN